MLRKNFKRKNDIDEDLEETINNNMKKRNKTFTNIIDKFNKSDEIEKAINKKNITLDDILKLNLPMDENIWFYEYLQILENTEEFTEEHYRIKNMISDKYERLKNVNIEELTKLKNYFDSNNDIIAKIISSNHDYYVKTILYKKYKRCYDNIGSTHSDELLKVTEWIDNILDLPTNTTNTTNTTNKTNTTNTTNISTILKNLWNNLNERIYGLTHVKEKVMEVVCAKLLDPNSKGTVLTLVGPPGVGKTAIATSIADSMEIPFDQISFGSVKDSTILTGQQSVWIGSAPGLFTKILLKSKRLDTLILLDEIDKIPDTPEGKSIASVLLHVLDRTQNYRFKDMYMSEIPLDLSKMVFVCASNSLENIDPILKNRMTIVEINGYSTVEKIEIAMTHMIPRIIQELGFSKTDIIISKTDLKYLIDHKTNIDNGMRDVERKLYQLFERLSLLTHAKEIPLSYKISNIKFPLKINENIINKLL